MIGENIKKLRERKDLTQGKLGEMVGASQSHVGRWERGEVEPRPKMKERLAEVLGVTVADLYKETPAPSEDKAGTRAAIGDESMEAEMQQYFRDLPERDFRLLTETLSEWRAGPREFQQGLEALLSLVQKLRNRDDAAPSRQQSQ